MAEGAEEAAAEATAEADQGAGAGAIHGATAHGAQEAGQGAGAGPEAAAGVVHMAIAGDTASMEAAIDVVRTASLALHQLWSSSLITPLWLMPEGSWI